MQTPINPFKQALREGRVQIGLWVGLADAYAIEAMAGTEGHIDTKYLCMGGR